MGTPAIALLNRWDGGSMPKKKVAGSRIGKWNWLRSLPRRDDLLALVSGVVAPLAEAGKSPDGSLVPADLMGFGLNEDQRQLVCVDALGVRARLSSQSYRTISELAGVPRSHETWRMVCRLYLEYSEALFTGGTPRLRLSRVARGNITEDVVKRWASGRMSTAAVVLLLGGGAVTPAHALYWIRKRAKHLGLGYLMEVKK